MSATPPATSRVGTYSAIGVPKQRPARRPTYTCRVRLGRRDASANNASIAVGADHEVSRERPSSRDNGRTACIGSDLRDLDAVVNRDPWAMINEIAQPLMDQRPGR
jgi:hypothetical protein